MYAYYLLSKLYQKRGAKRGFQFSMVEIDLKFPVGLNYGNVFVESLFRLSMNKLNSLEIGNVQSLKQSYSSHLRHSLKLNLKNNNCSQYLVVGK